MGAYREADTFIETAEKVNECAVELKKYKCGMCKKEYYAEGMLSCPECERNSAFSTTGINLRKPLNEKK